MKEDKRDNRESTLQQIPVPHLSANDVAEIESLVSAYVAALDQSAPGGLFKKTVDEASEVVARRILLRIDAIVLKGYQLPPRLERAVLDFFRGHQRRVPFEFTEYYPASFKPHIPLWMYASDDFAKRTSSRLLSNLPRVTDAALADALAELE